MRNGLYRIVFDELPKPHLRSASQFTTIPHIEHQARITRSEGTEFGGRHLRSADKALDLCQQWVIGLN